MNIHQLAATLAALRTSLTGSFPRGASAVLLEIMAACCALLVSLSRTLHTSADPRVAAKHSQLIENLYRYTLREQHHSIIHLESTGAHLLTDDELAALREDTTDFSRSARQHSGRAHYLNTADFLSNWLGLNPHEAKRRVNDAHLLIARRTIDGGTTTPRLAKLADLYANSSDLDPRLIARTARTLDSFEPADTCFDGQPLAPTERHADGTLLEDHAIALLSEPDRATREILLGDFLNAERKSRKLIKAPACGLFLQREVAEHDIYRLVVGGSQREELRSHIAQSDNPRTDAGKSARAGDDSTRPQPSKENSAHEADALFGSNDPMPPWAQDPTDDPAAEPKSNPEPDSAQQPLSEQHAQDQDLVNPNAQVPGDADVSVPQRRLNALIAALKNTHPGSRHKTVTPKIAVHIKLDSLQDLKNPGKLTSITEHGVKLSAADTGQLICQGEIYRVIFGPNSQPLDVGRSQRFFTEAMKRAIFARDRGCIVPGCSAPVEMLEYHHNQWWENDGCTSVRNGSCLCRAHHHAVHAGLMNLVIIDSLAHIVLPKHLDPRQIPQRNQIHLAAA